MSFWTWMAILGACVAVAASTAAVALVGRFLASAFDVVAGSDPPEVGDRPIEEPPQKWPADSPEHLTTFIENSGTHYGEED